MPDLDHSKLAVLNSLTSPASRRVYEYAIDQFIAWYCSEPRLAFNRIVVVRYRMYLEARGLAANTINQHLAAVRRLAHEAADSGLLSPELAAGISRAKGVKQLGFRSGNWLTAEQCSQVLKQARGSSLRAKRDYAMLAVLFGCGLRRSELVGLQMDDVQMRQGHWAIVDLIGKGGHIRTVPIPGWVKAALDEWAAQAGITQGRIFRAVGKMGKVWGKGVSQNVVWYVVKTCCERSGLQRIAPHDLRRTCAKLCHSSGGELEQIQFLLGHASVQTTERYLGCKQNLGHPVNDLFDLGADRKPQETSSELATSAPVENVPQQGLESRHGGSEYADPVPLLRTGQPSDGGRTEVAKVGTDDRSESLRPCSQPGIAGGNAAGKTDSGRDQAAFGPMGERQLTKRRKEIDHSVKPTERYLGCKQNSWDSAERQVRANREYP
ncbi:MAG TPA: tyrosine-type recombinase/integrase [Terriglobales bacterium]|nr:tyrosine-type recombinase/integrase [Terriglobales bacterium]